jgi:S1-C subfamily serine protease
VDSQILENLLLATVLIRSPRGHGSGFLVADSVIATCWHVVKGSLRIGVRLHGEEDRVVASLRGAIPSIDLALLECPTSRQPRPLKLSSHPPVGSRILAVGSPIDEYLFNTLTEGVVSAWRTSPPPGRIQFSASAHPGSSGGPLVSENGDVVGMVSEGYGSGAGIGLAIPGEALRDGCAEILNASGVCCVVCGTVSEDVAYCGLCGTDRGGRYLVVAGGGLQCSSCGGASPADALFCARCGNEFTDGDEL